MEKEYDAGRKVRSLYVSEYNEECELFPIGGSGSERCYFRVRGESGRSVIGTEGPDTRENASFVSLSRAFRECGQNVPEILAVGEGCECYLQEDLGNISLLPLLQTPERNKLSERVMERLVELQTLPPEVWRNHVFNKGFSRRQVMWDLNYFKYEFVKPAGMMCDEEMLENDFEELSRRLVNDGSKLWGFMYRDCQSRNVMIKDGEPWWIDYQGGRFGPMVYDAVSFLWQSKAGFSDEERRHLLEVYAAAMSRRKNVSEEDVLSPVGDFALFRTLQVLGAYGFRGLVEKKSHFVESIPGALENLKSLSERGVMAGMPELERVARDACGSRFARRTADDGLTLTVFSFSYKKGYPEDLSGNGGGFMFDCRGMHNPGRYDEYKCLTGRDSAVVEFLEGQGEVQAFVENALAVVKPSVECYMRRGFTSLQVGFGCTGGRHRSVYCAERFGREISGLYPGLRVRVVHRENPNLNE